MTHPSFEKQSKLGSQGDRAINQDPATLTPVTGKMGPVKGLTKRSQTWIRWVLIALIFVGCAFFLDLKKVLAAIGSISVSWLIVILLLMTADRMLMAWKWSLLLSALRVKLPFATVLRFYYQGSCVSTFLSAGVGGDVMRAHWVGRSTGAAPEVYASVLMEKILGFIVAVNLALIGAAVFAFNQWPETPVSWVLMATGATAVFNGVFVATLQPCVYGYLQRHFQGRPLSRIVIFCHRLYEAYSRFGKNRRAITRNGLLTGGEQVLQMLIMLTIAMSLGIDTHPMLFLSLTALYYLVSRLPISQDIWGLGEVAAVGFYGLIGITAEPAFALALLARVLHLIVVLPGLWFFWRMPPATVQCAQRG